MKQSDLEFEQRAKAALDAGNTALDADTRQRLAAMRARALASKPWWARWLPADNWVPATAFAAMAVLAATLFVVYSPPENPQQVALLDADVALEVMLGDDGSEAEADPDFYLWMEAQMLNEEDESHAG